MRSRASLAALALVVTVRVAAQQGDEDVLVAARTQMQSRNLDSAAVLLRRITDSTSWNDSARRMDALILLGIVRYYQGADSATLEAFGAALRLNPTLDVPRLAQFDSTLGALFDSARVTTVRSAMRDTLYSCSPRCRGLDVEPKPVGTGMMVPTVVAVGGRIPVRGSALLRAIVDTLGRVEPGSVQVVYSTLPPEIERSMVDGLRETRFSPGRAHGRAVRVLIERRVELSTARD